MKRSTYSPGMCACIEKETCPATLMRVYAELQCAVPVSLYRGSRQKNSLDLSQALPNMVITHQEAP
jgi:hypothetical protein